LVITPPARPPTSLRQIPLAIQRPSMGLLRWPTPVEIVGRPIGPALRVRRAIARNLRKPTYRCAAIPTFQS